MTFVKRQLSFQVQLGQGSFGNSGFNTQMIPAGLWASARINKVGAPAYNSADIEILGLPLSTMNDLSRVGLQPAAVRNNIITVFAGDEGAQPAKVFAGVIMEAWPDFSVETEGIMKISANTGLLAQMQTAQPISYTGTTDVATIMGTLAQQMGYTLENNGVSVQLSNPYKAGTAREQALAIAADANIYVYFEDDLGIMAIVPKNGSRNTLVPTLDAAAGVGTMVGYPSYVGPGLLDFTCEYNPQLRFLGNVTIQNSILTGAGGTAGANGTWRIISLMHDLSTHPNGPWFSRVRGNSLVSGN